MLKVAHVDVEAADCQVGIRIETTLAIEFPDGDTKISRTTSQPVRSIKG